MFGFEGKGVCCDSACKNGRTINNGNIDIFKKWVFIKIMMAFEDNKSISEWVLPE
ncbi:MAG: hypothetical protein ACP5T0_08390 [Verrucomicrobiia bacterium]